MLSIPKAKIETAANRRLVFAHQSGLNILEGVSRSQRTMAPPYASLKAAATPAATGAFTISQSALNAEHVFDTAKLEAGAASTETEALRPELSSDGGHLNDQGQREIGAVVHPAHRGGKKLALALIKQAGHACQA